MELNIFMRELESALVERGISDETAKKHVSNLRRTFTEDDLSEIEAIQSESEIEQLADSISLILTKTPRTPPRTTPPRTDSMSQKQPNRTAQTQNRSVTVRENGTANGNSQMQRTQNQQSRVHVAQPRQRKLELPEDDDEYYSYAPGNDATTRGMLIFWVGLFLTLPLTLGLAAVFFGAFAALFVGLAALIAGLIAVLIAVAACGAGVSLVGIIFGITQLFTFLSAGIYEIGLGIMVAGAVLFVSIILYNIAVRFLPWVISLLANLLGWLCGKLKNLFLVVRRECYKL